MSGKDEITIDKIVKQSELREMADAITKGDIEVAMLIYVDEQGIVNLCIAGKKKIGECLGWLELAKQELFEQSIVGEDDE